MTSHRYHRCDHCQVSYTYQASGGGMPAYNHDRYCPDCYRVVLEALRAIPAKVKRVNIPVSEVFGDEVTLDILLAWEREAAEKARERGGLHVRRISAPLFDLEGGRTQRTGWVRGRDGFSGWYFQYGYWEGEEDKAEVVVEMERNCETGELRRWGFP